VSVNVVYNSGEFCKKRERKLSNSQEMASFSVFAAPCIFCCNMSHNTSNS